MKRSVPLALVLALLGLVAACGSGSDDDSGSALSTKQAEARTCAEVRAGIASFNRQDYPGTVSHFKKAKITAKVYAKISDKPEADALLDAVEYYVNLDPADYPEAARSSESFARNKTITLNQCASDGPVDDVPTQNA